MITCGRRWTPEEIVRNVSKQLNVAQRDIDNFDFNSLNLSLIDEVGQSTTIDDLRKLSDGNKVLVEVSNK
jgi:hypothetical protein